MSSEFSRDPTLRSYVMLVRRRKWWVAGLALLGLVGSLALALIQPEQYSATAQLLVQPSGASTALGGAQAPVTPTDVQTDLQLVTGAPVQRAVSKRLHGQPAISAAEIAQTNVIAITAISSTPARAALVANTYATAFVSYLRAAAFRDLAAAEAQLRTQIRSLGNQIRPLRRHASAAPDVAALVNQQAVLREQLAQMQVSGTVATGGVEVVALAQPPASPSSPKPLQNGIFGLMAGLILGLAAALLRDNFDDALTSKEEVEQLAGAPVLAMIPKVANWKRREQPLVVSASLPISPAAEAYRSLRTSLQFARQESDLRTLLVTSPAASEGKTSTIANLGVVFAQAGERVVLVSCDLRRPRLGQFFGLAEHVGLTGILAGQQTMAEALQPVRCQESLWLLGAGPLPPNPAELLNGPDAREVFASLRATFDLVLIDSPPVLPVTDAVVLSQDADGTMLVVAAGQTKPVDLQRATEKLAQVNATVVATVLNEVTSQNGYGYGSGYGYGYGHPPMQPDVSLAGVPAQANGHVPTTASGRGKRRRSPGQPADPLRGPAG